jgi:uncharacterized protein DUF4154
VRALRPILLVCALVAPTVASAEFEHEVKAAFLFQFLSYVEWPEQSFKDDHSPFVIAVLDADEVRADLQQLVQGRTALGRPVEVRRVYETDSLKGVHLLFVGHEDVSVLPEVAGKKGVLVVSEAEGALDRGAMVNLVRVGDHVRFQVCPDAAERGGLKISSRMLSVAQFVKQERP